MEEYLRIKRKLNRKEYKVVAKHAKKTKSKT